MLYRMVQKTVFSECNQLLCHGWRRERQLLRHSVLCHPSADKEIIQKEFEKPKGAKTSHCAVISIREFFPRNSSIIYSSKDLPTKKKQGRRFVSRRVSKGRHVYIPYKKEFPSEWLSC